MRSIISLIVLMLAGCGGGTPAPAVDSAPKAARGSPAADAGELDAAARDYVMLTLEIGTHESGYVDAYYGPADWAAAAAANPRDTAALAAAADALGARLARLDATAMDGMERQRVSYLAAHVAAARARLRMIDGERPAFADEAEQLFGIRPQLRPLAEFDPALARIAELVPGEGELAARVAAFRDRYLIPPDKLDAVMRAAIAECRSRTLRHIALPDAERFTLEFVTGRPWSGYNYYQGDASSLIQINTDLPVQISRAVDLGCHEGYPGHHVYNTLLERTFVQERGWVEMSIFPLFSPMALVAEGSANYGIDLAFPGGERLAFEREVLYPLAGLDPATATALDELQALTRALAGAEFTIADDYLAGRSDRDQAVGLLQTYGLTSRERAEQRLDFIDTYRSYLINYSLGRDLVEAWITRQGADPWAAMQDLLSSQRLPVDLVD